VCLDHLVDHLDTKESAVSWGDVHPLYVERFGPDASAIGPPEGGGA
jgi:hypothetical protein